MPVARAISATTSNLPTGAAAGEIVEHVSGVLGALVAVLVATERPHGGGATPRRPRARLLVAREPRRAGRGGAGRAVRRAAHRRAQFALATTPADRPAAMLFAIRVARAHGCVVTQNPAVGDSLRGSHVASSKHYQRYPGSSVGRAIDVYCGARAMRAYFRWAERNRKRIFLDDLFHDPIGYSYDAGRVWGVVIGGHSDHVHLSI